MFEYTGEVFGWRCPTWIGVSDVAGTMADIAIKVISVTVATRVSNAERGALSTAFAMITDWVVPSGRAGRPRILASWWR